MNNRSQIGKAGIRRWWAAVLIAVVAVMVPSFASIANADAEIGDRVWIGAKQGYSGTGIFPVYLNTPADVDSPGEPDYWAYCIEHDVSPKSHTDAEVHDASGYLGENLFSDPEVQGKVLWVLAHSFPALSLDELGAAANVSGLTLNDAVEATQYAIWRYTDLGFDADWYWETPASETVYKYLIAGANASAGMNQADLAVTVSLDAPMAEQKPESLVGPFVVHTDQPSATLSVDSGWALVDKDGVALGTNDVANGTEFFVDARGVTEAGTATITASVVGSSAFGRILSVPTQFAGTPTAEDHAQSVILVAPHSKVNSAQATATWKAAETSVVTGGGAPDVKKASNQLANTGATSQAPLTAGVTVVMLAAGAVLLLSRKDRTQ